MFIWVFFVVCIIQELKLDSRKHSRLVVKRISIQINHLSIPMALRMCFNEQQQVTRKERWGEILLTFPERSLKNTCLTESVTQAKAGILQNQHQNREGVCDPDRHCESKQRLPHAEVQAVPGG